VGDKLNRPDGGELDRAATPELQAFVEGEQPLDLSAVCHADLQRVMRALAGGGDSETLRQLRDPTSPVRRMAEDINRVARKKIDLRQIPGLEQYAEEGETYGAG